MPAKLEPDFTMHKQALLFQGVRTLCMEAGGRRGIWKRIDENRELLAFLQGNAPGLLARYPFMEGWLGNQDIFLVNLLRLLELPDALPSFGAGFPRPWPGNPATTEKFLEALENQRFDEVDRILNQ